MYSAILVANLRCILLPFYNLQRLRHKWKPPKEIFVSSRNNQPKQQFSKLPMEWTCKKLDVDPNTSNFSYTIFPFKAAYHINLRFAVFAKNIPMYILHEEYFVLFFTWNSNKLPNLHNKKDCFLREISSVNATKNLTSYNFVNPKIFHYCSCIVRADKKVCFIDTWLAKG